MKRRVLTILCCLSAMFTISMNSNAQGTLIHYWNFNSFTATEYTPTITPVPADFSVISSPVASVVETTLPGTSSAYSTYFDYKAAVTADYDTMNLRMGAIDGNWVRCRNPCDSMQFVWYMPTTGYTNLLIKYGTEASSISGASIQNYSYSVDSGTTWITSGGLSTQMFVMDTVGLSTDTFRLASVRVTDPAAANNPKFVFRITFEYHNTGATGNDRFDNISLDGDVISLADTALIVNAIPAEQSYTLSPNPVTNSLNVGSNIDGPKSIVMYNAIGERIYTGQDDSKNFTISTANLNAGIYIISIRDNNTGEMNTTRFIKQ